MRKLALLLSLFCLLGACTGEDPPPIGNAPIPSPLAAAASQGDADIYAAVIESLVDVDRKGRFDFDRVFVIDGPVEGASDPMRGFARSSEPFSGPMKEALVERLSDLPSLEFIADAHDVITGRNSAQGVEDYGVIITLGPLRRRSTTRFDVGHNQWRGLLCGEWSTSVVKLIEAEWKVTGTTGPVAIS